MNIARLLRLMARTGRAAEKAPPKPEAAANDKPLPKELKGSVQIRHVDAGSCNGCEVEIGAAFSPTHDGERYGARLVASPRHADVLLVTGVVTHNMAESVRRTVDATPNPRLVVAVGECARNCGVFKDGHGVAGAVSDIVPVDLEVPGCPPEPEQIIEALRTVTKK